MTQGGQRSDELLQVSRVQAFVQRLEKRRHISGLVSGLGVTGMFDILVLVA